MSAKKRRHRGGLVGHLRGIADILESRRFYRFPAYLREAAKEISYLRWENGVLRHRLKMKPRARDRRQSKGLSTHP